MSAVEKMQRMCAGPIAAAETEAASHEQAEEAGRELRLGAAQRLLYRCAGNMKILMDTPEQVCGACWTRVLRDVCVACRQLEGADGQIWTCLEDARLYRATTCYMRAQAIRAALHSDEDPAVRALLQAFPVLATQWAAIDHFREVGPSTGELTCRLL